VRCAPSATPPALFHRDCSLRFPQMDVEYSNGPTELLRVIAARLAEVASGHGTEMVMRKLKICDAGAEQIAIHFSSRGTTGEGKCLKKR
jgi:hypothetical protein